MTNQFIKFAIETALPNKSEAFIENMLMVGKFLEGEAGEQARNVFFDMLIDRYEHPQIPQHVVMYCDDRKQDIVGTVQGYNPITDKINVAYESSLLERTYYPNEEDANADINGEEHYRPGFVSRYFFKGKTQMSTTEIDLSYIMSGKDRKWKLAEMTAH